MIYATSTEIKSNFGKYLDLVLAEGEVTIMRHKRPIARIVAITVPRQEEIVAIKEEDKEG